jgi:hypothetical protein
MVLTYVIATNADKVFSDFSNGPYGTASQIQSARLPCLTTSKASVDSLSPVILSVQGYLTSELLRFL